MRGETRGCSSRLFPSIKLREINGPLLPFFLEHLEPRFQPFEPIEDQRQDLLRLVELLRPGNGGVAEVALEGGEEVERVLLPVGPGDFPFLLAKENRLLRFRAVPLANPQLSLFNSLGLQVANNDNWGGNATLAAAVSCPMSSHKAG